ncbi:MAG: 50S ribosomal protein L3 [Candidatus Pacebacteria bacterium]|jgi:large subunit ribosomal protein L3|nr:50S ribosomal protein L3 [Candidatus Paceibacterota bacterium]MDD3072152.1 50S ribosomal protein L3 [Candidatus Paceibacterota bacterium]MDD3728783.1 50S ribosomal protein L3 [Candidatus Paceibacterota bacterium]MDD4201358.1 50S ribosomal protein L3 [Candidatus Paceibacterota bacterium]MDD4466915.1 50S ribosomal protein L3 [Candidatus Paceibacterota bacterium]
MSFILGKKIKMSQIFDESGKVVPVTVVEAGPVFVLQIKKKEGKDNYDAVAVGFLKIEKKNKIKKTAKGKEFKHIKEFKSDNELKIGDKIDVSVFNKGDKVDVSGFSKGKGYTGVVKRWNFTMKPATHGTKHTQRAMGSTGGRFPQRVVKGRKMPGRLGFEKTTVKKLKIEAVDAENNLILLRGAVPGRPGTILSLIKV